MRSLWLEVRFALGEKSVRWTMALALLMSSYAVVTGIKDVNTQHQQIEGLVAEAKQDRDYTLTQHSDAGSAAYYVHHFTYDPPSTLAFASAGTRSYLPWKHRIRMLALEGQIYESDAGNPELARLGRLDFAFVLAVLLPLLTILLLYDLDGRERRSGLYELLCATSRAGQGLFWYRAGARVGLLLAVTFLPFVIAALLSRAGIPDTLRILLIGTVHAAFWMVVCRWIGARVVQGATAAVTLLGVWLLLAVAVPIGGKLVAERTISVPAGGELLLKQREAVNDAWDLPKEATMQPFVASHPQWRAASSVTQPFEWKWYYAFQQMGDEQVAAESDLLRRGLAQRDLVMGWVAVMSPPLWVERQLSQIAHTDVGQHLHYNSCIRSFHRELREFHYPMLFDQQPYSAASMQQLPQFAPCS